MAQNAPQNPSTEPQTPPTCYTVTDLLYPEERKDNESPLAFSSWQVVGKF